MSVKHNIQASHSPAGRVPFSERQSPGFSQYFKVCTLFEPPTLLLHLKSKGAACAGRCPHARGAQAARGTHGSVLLVVAHSEGVNHFLLVEAHLHQGNDSLQERPQAQSRARGPGSDRGVQPRHLGRGCLNSSIPGLGRSHVLWSNEARVPPPTIEPEAF